MLRVERHGNVVSWTIARPETKNALDHATMARIVEVVREADADRSIRAAVLTGAGDTFVSGGDLRELRGKSTEEDAERLTDAGHAVCAAIESLSFPVIAALPGPAIGGGAELALACDIRIADERAKISFRQVRMGVTTSWGSVPRLLSLVSAGTAARLLYAGHEPSAHEAKRLGLFDEVTENGDARTTAFVWATDIANGSPRAVSAMKRLVRAAKTPSTDVRALERELFVETWTGADHVEAVEAFFERRGPRWNDR